MSGTDRVSEVVSRLEAAILSGEFSPGDALPPEREISSQFGVSRSVVREALGRLASIGLVRSQHGSGTRVQAPNSRAVTEGYTRLLKTGVFNQEDLVDVRLPLETQLTGKAALYRTEQHLMKLEQSQAILGTPNLPLDDYIRADLDFHATLALASGNPIFEIVLQPIQQLLIEGRRATLTRDGESVAHKHHQIILQAVREQDPDTAAQAMYDHITYKPTLETSPSQD